MQQKSPDQHDKFIALKAILADVPIASFEARTGVTVQDLRAYLALCGPDVDAETLSAIGEDEDVQRRVMRFCHDMEYSLQVSARVENKCLRASCPALAEEIDRQNKVAAERYARKMKFPKSKKEEFFRKKPHLARALVRYASQATEGALFREHGRVAKSFCVFDMEIGMPSRKLGDVRLFEVPELARRYGELAYIFQRLGSHIGTMKGRQNLSSVRSAVKEELVQGWLDDWRRVYRKYNLIADARSRLDRGRWRRDPQRIAEKLETIDAALTALGDEALKAFGDEYAAYAMKRLLPAAA